MTEGGGNDWNTDDIESVDMNWNTPTGWTDSVSGMFEGLINFDSTEKLFIGDISPAIPDDSNEYIDTDRYHMLSFGIVGNNPNQEVAIGTCAMYIKWIDSSDEEYGWYNLLQNTGYSVGNGWDMWSTVGPVDLDSVSSFEWGNDDAKELWIRFQAGATSLPVVIPIDIRIGWIRLEESAQ